MDRLNARNDGYARTHQLREWRDLARVIHADLEYGIFRTLRTPGKGERNAPMIVVRSDGGMGFTVGRERKAQCIFGPGLADRARHGDDFSVHARTRSTRKIAQTFENIGHNQERRTGKAHLLAARYHGKPGSGFERTFHEIMAISILALDREKRITLGKRTAIDRDAG